MVCWVHLVDDHSLPPCPFHRSLHLHLPRQQVGRKSIPAINSAQVPPEADQPARAVHHGLRGFAGWSRILPRQDGQQVTEDQKVNTCKCSPVFVSLPPARSWRPLTSLLQQLSWLSSSQSSFRYLPLIVDMLAS